MPNEALRKIGIVSKELDLPIHVIRFWEKKIEVLTPIKKPNGTRYFSKDQMQILKEIKFLLYKKKYSIEGVNLFFKERKQMKGNSQEKELITEIEGLINEIKVRKFSGA